MNKLGKKNTFIVIAVVCAVVLFFIGHNAYSKQGSPDLNIVSQQDAERLVEDLPEVKSMINTGNTKWKINAEDKTNYWYVQVAEIVDDSEADHTSTFNWYKINKNKSEIVCSMYPYDNEGNLIESEIKGDCN